MRNSLTVQTRTLALGLSMVATLAAAQVPTPSTRPATKKPAAKTAPAPVPTPVLEPKAIEILKAACNKLAEARSMSFTALGAYEVTSLWGPPLIYGRIY